MGANETGLLVNIARPQPTEPHKPFPQTAGAGRLKALRRFFPRVPDHHNGSVSTPTHRGRDHTDTGLTLFANLFDFN
jgi:hypothetical protein